MFFYIRETEFESQTNPEKEDGVIFILNLEFCLTHGLQRWSESLILKHMIKSFTIFDTYVKHFHRKLSKRAFGECE